MRKRLLFYGLAAVAMVIAVWACRRVGLDAGQGKPEPKITVEEARAFFENQWAATKGGTGLAGGHDHMGFSPGDFTPMWSRATRAAANQWVEGVDLPIDPTYIFTASFSRAGRNGDTVYRTVDIVQKLVVNRWHDHPEWDGMYAYIATIIPTPEYYARHRNFGRKFIVLGNKGDFSGWMLGHNMQGKLVSIARYDDGAKTRYWYDGDGSGIPTGAVTQMLEGAAIYTGTRAMYEQHVEAPDVFVYFCQRCKMQNCPCQNGGAGCFCRIKDDTETPDPTPPDPPIDGDNDDKGGGSGGSGGSFGFQTQIATKLFTDLKNSLDANKWIAIESILEDLSRTKLGSFVINYLLNGGTITIVVGSAPGHEGAFGSYALELNTLYVKEIPMLGSDQILNRNNESVFRQTMTEETFHAFQYRVYGDRFNKLCFEFEARVYGPIVMHMMGQGMSPGGSPYILSAMDKSVPASVNRQYFNDIQRMTDNFTHGIGSSDMKVLFENYGQYCNGYGEGDTNWEFIAIERAGTDMGELH